jgi:hypothetical protein
LKNNAFLNWPSNFVDLSMGKKDLNQIAKFIIDQATGDTPKPPKKKEGQQLGGIKGGKARAEKLSSKRRSEIAKKAAKKRWG